MKSVKRNILLTPGPATTTDSVKYAQVVPDICPRGKEFTNILNEVRTDLVRIVNGNSEEYTSVLFAGSGTAVMDAVINSVVPPDKKIAVIVNGAYGERMVKIAESYNIPYEKINFVWGERIDISKIEKKLKEDQQIAAVAIVHHETTTGIINPIKEVGEISKKNECVFIVDAISSFAGIPIDIKECNVDFLMSTSNKCIQGMAGMAFAICKKSELLKIKSYPKRSFYLDLYSQYEYFERSGQMQFTAPVQVAYSLRQAIKEYFEEGEQARYDRYTENWRVLRNGLKEMGFKFLLKEENESHLLLTVFEPDSTNYSFEKMHDFLYEGGFTIYPGKIGGKNTFRLATIGAIYPADIGMFIEAVKKFLNCLKDQTC